MNVDEPRLPLVNRRHRLIVLGGRYDGLLALEGVGPKIAHLLRSVAFGQVCF